MKQKLLTVLIFFLLWSCNNTEGKYIEAEHLYLTGKPDKAYEIVIDLLSKNKKDLRFFKLAGNCLFMNKSYKEALNYYDLVLRAEEDTSALFQRAKCYCNLSLIEGALNDLNRIIRIDTTRADLYIERGKVYESIKSYREAITDYNKALDIDSLNYIALNNKGVSHENLGEYTQAIDCYNKILINSKFDSRIYYNRAIAQVHCGNFSDAIIDLTAAINLNPFDGTYYYNRGVVYQLIHDMNHAYMDWRKAVELGNEDAKESLKMLNNKKGSTI